MSGARAEEARAPFIVALDLATCTGYALGDGSRLPEVGHIRLPPVIEGERGNTFDKLRWFVMDKITKARGLGRDVMVVVEKPILPKAFIKGGRIIYPTNLETTMLLQGMVAIVEQLCYEQEVDIEAVDVPTVKKMLAGHGGADKADMVHVARKCGLTITVDDEADAFAIFLCALQTYNRRASERFDALVWGSRGALL
jgi:hypothetical protein